LSLRPFGIQLRAKKLPRFEPAGLSSGVVEAHERKKVVFVGA